MSSHFTCGLLFESDPLWLWSLRPNSWSKIFLTGPDESKLRQDHPVLFSYFENKIEIIPTTFAGNYPSVSPDYMWVVGTKCFIDMLTLPPVGCHVYCLVNSGRRFPVDLKHIQWTKLIHRNVGGVTNARGSFGIDSRSKPIRLSRDLCRTLGHVIKYSIRPRVCDPDPGFVHYTVSDVLSLSLPRRPILYPTYMSRTGWGIRESSNKELALRFELPDYVSWNDRFLRNLVPLQMCRAVIDSVMIEDTPGEPLPRRQKVDHHESDHLLSSAQDVVWLTGIERWLPGSWADADISDKAVKSDNAPVDFKPWHCQIQLVLPA